MLRTMGLAMFLSLFMLGCGGGGGQGASGLPTLRSGGTPALVGTVSGLVGAGLTLAICPPSSSRGGTPKPCYNTVQVGVDGAFTLPGGSASDYIIAQQPTAPTQRCILSSDPAGVTVACAVYAYVANAADHTLSSFRVNPSTGALTPLGPPTPTGASPEAILGLDIGAGKRFLYVGNKAGNDVSAFAVNPVTGAIANVSGSPFPAGTGPQAMASYGPYLYVANSGSDTVSVFPMDLNTGALAAPSTLVTGKSPSSMVFDPFSGILFVANHGGSNDISAFRAFDQTPVLGSPFPAGGNPLCLAVGGVGAGGKFVYSANPDPTNPTITGFTADPSTFVVTPLGGSPFSIPVSQCIAADQTGAYLYVTQGADIVGYAIDIFTGALTALPGFPVTAGANAHSINVDPTNQFLYVADDGAAEIAAFRLDASTGALTPMTGSPFPAGNRPDSITTF